jgi:hypothetical protein
LLHRSCAADGLADGADVVAFALHRQQHGAPDRRALRTRLSALPWMATPCYTFSMNAQDAIATLRRYESALRARRGACCGVRLRGPRRQPPG